MTSKQMRSLIPGDTIINKHGMEYVVLVKNDSYITVRNEQNGNVTGIMFAQAASYEVSTFQS